jgi:coenzyme PQQ precursor peptide PqqA
MIWTTPTLVEICIGLEINGYLPAEFRNTPSLARLEKPGEKPGFFHCCTPCSLRFDPR